ncbi:MAG: hypothetical protein KAJ78_01045 [Acidobacteria bacterium]|nr:hypothetical protein [Acidobacteriota bacterium]
MASSRANFYQLQFTPYMWFNGADDAGYDYADWGDDLGVHQEQETDVTIDVFTALEGPILRVFAKVCIEEGGLPRDMRIFTLQVIDNFPDSPTYYRNAGRQGQSKDVTLEAGQCIDVDTLAVMPSLDLERPEDFAVIVWAQEPLSTAPAEIFQVAIGGRRRPISPESLIDQKIQEAAEDQGW